MCSMIPSFKSTFKGGTHLFFFLLVPSSKTFTLPRLWQTWLINPQSLSFYFLLYSLSLFSLLSQWWLWAFLSHYLKTPTNSSVGMWNQTYGLWFFWNAGVLPSLPFFKAELIPCRHRSNILSDLAAAAPDSNASKQLHARSSLPPFRTPRIPSLHRLWSDTLASFFAVL